MIFSQTNALERLSFEASIRQMGGHPIYLSPSDIALGRRETVQDTAKAISGYGLHCLIASCDAQADLVDLAKYGKFSVVNAKSNDFHPLQALADYLTLFERFKRLKGLKLVYIGTGGNICHSLMIAGAKLGVEVVCVCPPSHLPNKDILTYCSRFGNVTLEKDPMLAVAGADAIYTTTHPNNLTEKQKSDFDNIQVTEEMFALAHPGCCFMHNMPPQRNVEATSNVVGAPYSVMYQQATNRLHVQKATIALLLRK